MATITVKQAGGGDFDDINDALQNVGLSAGAGAGDIVEVYDGIYTEGIVNNLPSGTSWASPFIIRAAPAQTPTLKNPGESNIRIYGTGGEFFYATIQGFILDGTNLSNSQVLLGSQSNGPSSIRVDSCELIHTEYNSAMYLSGYSSDLQIIDNHIHGGTMLASDGVGGGWGHGIYLAGNNSLIQGNLIHEIAGFGMQLYAQIAPQPHDNIVRYNTIYRVGLMRHVAAGILISGDRDQAYKNIVYNVRGANGDGGVGITADGNNQKVNNNTVYFCSWIGLDLQSSDSNEVKNNITYNNGQNTDFTGANGYPAPTNLDASNNLIGVDPLFVDSAHGDFHLQANSTAIDYGTPVNLAYVGDAPDAGAFEYGGQDEEEPPVNTGSGSGGTEPPPVETPPTPTAPILPVVRDWVNTEGSIKDQYNQGLIVAERDSSNQYIYTLNIPAGSLAIGSKIRLKATVHIATTTPPDCEVCVPSTNPGEQDLDIVYTYEYRFGIPNGTLTGNVCGQINFIASDGTEEEFIATAANRSGFATSYDYPAIIGERFNTSNWQVLHFEGTRGERVEPVSVPFGYEGRIVPDDASSGHSGHSDEFGYLIAYIIETPVSEVTTAYFSYESGEVTFLTLPATYASTPNTWTKYENEIFGLRSASGIAKWTLSQGFLGIEYPAGGKTYLEVFATENWLWGLTSSQIVKLDKVNLEVQATYDISDLTGVTTFFMIGEQAAYIGDTGGNITYMQLASEELTQIGTYPFGDTGDCLMHFRKGYFYFVPHNFGFGGGLTTLFKVGPLYCPGTEIVLGD